MVHGRELPHDQLPQLPGCKQQSDARWDRHGRGVHGSEPRRHRGGGAYPPVDGLGNKDAAAIVQIRSDGNYDASVHIDQAAAYEIMHVYGHGSYSNNGIDNQGHDGQSKKVCMDRSWYGNCKRWEYNIMYPTFSPALRLWMYAKSEEAVESYSYKYL